MNFITLEECECVVRNYFDSTTIKIESYAVEKLSNVKTGHLGEYYKLKIQLKAKPELILFVKKVLETPNRPQFVELVTQKELLFYNFLNDLKRNVPNLDTSFLPGFYHATKQYIVLEDLSQSGFVLPKCANFDDLQLKLALESLAKLHTATLAYQEIISDDFHSKHVELLKEGMYSNDENYIGHTYMTCLTKGICNLIDCRLHSDLDPEIFKKLFVEEVAKTLKLLNGANFFRKVVCHGDLWHNNMFFKYANSDVVNCKLIDFQLIRYASPAHDVTTLIFHNTDVQTRQDSYVDLIDYYYKCLNKELDKCDLDINAILSRDEFDVACHVYGAVAKIAKILRLGFEAATKARSLLNIKKPLDAIMSENNQNFIVDVLENNNEYRERVIENLKIVVDLLKNPLITKECCYIIIKEITTNYILKQYKTQRNYISGLDTDYKLMINIIDKNESKQLNFCVKKMSQKKIHEFSAEFNWFSKIVPVFMKYKLNLISEIIQKCYLSRRNDVLVFNDLQSQNYELICSRKPFGLDEVKLVIKAMSKLHASGYILQKKLANERAFLNVLIESCKGTNLVFENAEKRIHMQANLFPHLFKNISKEKFAKFVALGVKNLHDVEVVKTCGNTICHGNLSHANIMMKFLANEPVDCKLINFTSYNYAPPTNDLLLFLRLTTIKSFRKYCTGDLLDFYYEELDYVMNQFGCNLQDVLSYNAFVESCRKSKLYALFNSVLHHQRALLDEKFSFGSYSCYTMYEIDENMMKDMCDSDPIYKNTLMEMMEDVCETFLECDYNL